ncbi:unnamed protein product [Caenorhabditis angaria]|uniref:T20D4.11-like domain-containing protein n=1 Tax=Caenorhabditis angaria TaxID=860376 RepID=A0A9P1J4M8_9PELO|nr:unnamed protein product [Caenorhabditis angaria]
MKLLFLLLILFSTWVFAEEDTIYHLQDYEGPGAGQHPYKCYIRAYLVVNVYNFTAPNETVLREAKTLIDDCIEDLSHTNYKVAQVKTQLAQKIFDTFKFSTTIHMPCYQKLRKIPYRPCYIGRKYGGGSDFCNFVWGPNGCIIEVFDKYCGPEVVEGLRKYQPFLFKENLICVDKYTPKN